MDADVERQDKLSGDQSQRQHRLQFLERCLRKTTSDALSIDARVNSMPEGAYKSTLQ